MNARTRAVIASCSVLVLATSVDAATIRFVNGREITARDYWYTGRGLAIADPHGTVVVPRDFVASIDGTPPVGTIERGADTVNADTPGLSADAGSVSVFPPMPTKDELYGRAVDFVADGDLDQAIALYQEALAIDPAFADALHGLAMAYADKEMFDEAIAHAHRLIELTPDDTLAHTSLSMFYQRKGLIDEAEAEGAKARVLDWKRKLGDDESDGS